MRLHWWQFLARRHCPHSWLYAIWGDAINYTPGYRRLSCIRCGQLLDGSPVLAAVRQQNETPEGNPA